jgi:serine/threonine protein kinase/Tol biopolymer transport system component
MGEVYLAQDRTLERNVALKVLPPELVRSEDRVRRFVREAKSASSLNHPNIVTIYEIGQDDVHPSGAGAVSSAVHYISMELVSGETLSTKIHQEKTDLRTLLGYLAQAAEGLAKAHAAGIVHRDLKPGNIMVSKDGFAKVLDFGLAKLTERESTDAEITVAPGEGEEVTSAGAVIGTVGYMSPEQVRGGTVDSRSDIFSFGCILYEAATRKKPFVAESNVEIMHKILHDKPLPIEDLNKNAPAELRRLIRRCLAKNPEQRLQSAKDLAIELREIVDEYDTLSASGSSGSGSGSSVLPAAIAQKKIPSAALVAGSVVLAGLIVAGVLLLGHRTPEPQGAAPGLRISAITSRGGINGAAISPDGRYVAYSLIFRQQRTLWVHQVATGSDVQILPPQTIPPTGLIFSPDGNYLYYQSADPDRDGYTAIFAIPTLGGAPRKVAYDVDSRISFSPDGKRICFRRGVPNKNREDLVIRDLDQGQERVLASATGGINFGGPCWSPDGKRIAIPETNGTKTSLFTYRLEDGRREPLGKTSWIQGNLALSDAWLPDGKGIIISGFDPSTFTEGQLWLVGYPDGQATRVTSDLSFYTNTTISADGRTIGAVRLRQEANLWTASPAGRDVHQITFGGEDATIQNFSVGPDSTILYGAVKDGQVQIFRVGVDGSGEQSITSSMKIATDPRFQPAAGIVFFRVGDDLIPHIWRMDADGENARALTSGKGEFASDVSQDGRTILFYRLDQPDVLWSMPSSGGPPVRLGPSARTSGLMSPDNIHVLHTAVQDVHGQGAFVNQVIPVNGVGPVLTPAIPQRVNDMQWTPDGKALSFSRTLGDVMNLYRVALDGSAPTQITHFTDGRIFQHKWSPDGRRIVVRRLSDFVGNLWVVNADGTNPVEITDFETGAIQDMKWSADGSRVLFTYGTSSQNVVLIRNFQ